MRARCCPEVIKLFFNLNSAEHEILTAHEYWNSQNQWKLQVWITKSQSFILLINVKMPTIVGILTFMSRINFDLSWVEHDKSFITPGPGFWLRQFLIISYLLLFCLGNSISQKEMKFTEFTQEKPVSWVWSTFYYLGHWLLAKSFCFWIFHLYAYVHVCIMWAV